MELKLFDRSQIVLARKISELIIESTYDFMESHGGHVPDKFVTGHIHRLYATVESVVATFYPFGHRFVLMDGEKLLATILISKEPDSMFILDSKRMNVRITPEMTVAPLGYHWIINYVVHRQMRNNGLARFLLNSVRQEKGLWSGRGFAAKVEPPLHEAFSKLGFKHLTQFDAFFPPGAILPQGIETPSEFNSRYRCGCENLSPFYDTHKIKDLSFVLDFAEWEK